MFDVASSIVDRPINRSYMYCMLLHSVYLPFFRVAACGDSVCSKTARSCSGVCAMMNVFLSR
jgi:hypothetical protein